MSSDRFAAAGAAGLQSPMPGLYVTPAAPLPYLDGVVVRSFLLERKDGNILIDNAPGIAAARDDILALGRPDRLLLTHWHEAMYGEPGIDVPIFVSERDRARTDLPNAGTFTGDEAIGDDLRIIPTPGHTAGSAMFLWDSGEHRLLFTGDTVWAHEGKWQAMLLGESDRAAYLDTLAMVADLDFDVLVPWGADEGAPVGYAVTHSEARDHLAAIADRLRTGKNA